MIKAIAHILAGGRSPLSKPQYRSTNIMMAQLSELDTPTCNPNREPLKHLLIGSPKAVSSTIHHLQVIGYASVGDWSPLLPTANPGEVMSILIRQILMQ